MWRPLHVLLLLPALLLLVSVAAAPAVHSRCPLHCCGCWHRYFIGNTHIGLTSLLYSQNIVFVFDKNKTETRDTSMMKRNVRVLACGQNLLLVPTGCTRVVAQCARCRYWPGVLHVLSYCVTSRVACSQWSGCSDAAPFLNLLGLLASGTNSSGLLETLLLSHLQKKITALNVLEDFIAIAANITG
uniref:SFRICE_010431 n=1 Tax=Spodoptera frugiperda TaxID=7108 RepID=A0A2H1VXG2_SPOFR